MAITITDRPRIFYYTQDSPAIPVYSNWNAAWNPIVYTFNVQTSADILSSLLIEIFEVGTNTKLSSDTYRPFKLGTWNVDVSPKIKSYLFSAYAPNFTSSDNSVDAGNALNFYITYTQIFDNDTPQIFNSEQTKPIVAVCSALQPGDVNGGNMAQYVPFNFDLVEAKKMKFLSLFDKPVMWAGWPFTLSWIYSTNILGVQIIKEENQLNGNKVSLVSNDTNLSQVPAGKVNYLKVNAPSYPNARYMKVSLKTGEPIENTYVDSGYVDEGYTQIT